MGGRAREAGSGAEGAAEMRLIRRLPVIEAALEDGRFNTTQLGILSTHFTAENVEDLVRRETETKELGVSQGHHR